MVNIKSLPDQTQQEIRSWLTVYKTCTVTYANGRYHVGNLCIQSHYASDDRMIGTIKNTDIYTPDEIRANNKMLENCQW
jgi:hypothetical protein